MFGCTSCTTKYDTRAGNFDIQPNMKSGFSNKCKSCRIKWHIDYRSAIHSTDTIDHVVKDVIKINSKTISDKEAEKLMDVANNLQSKSKIVEVLTLSDMKIFVKQKNYEQGIRQL